MQKFLGTVLFLSPFLPNWLTVSAPLYETLKNTYVWSDEDNIAKRKVHYQELLQALSEHVSLHYLDHSLPWILRTDTSTLGYSGVLVQIKDGKEVQILATTSRKFSKPARNSTTGVLCYRTCC
jgi:hypothetical protein